MIERVSLDQSFRSRKFRFAHGEDFKLSAGSIFSKLAQELVGILAVDDIRPNFDRKRRYHFSGGQAGDSDEGLWGACDNINGRRADLAMIELYQRTGIEKVSGQRSPVLAFRADFSGHRTRNFGKPSPNFFQPRRRVSSPQFSSDPLDIFDGQCGSRRDWRGLNDAHDYALMLVQIQGL